MADALSSIIVKDLQYLATHYFIIIKIFKDNFISNVQVTIVIILMIIIITKIVGGMYSERPRDGKQNYRSLKSIGKLLNCRHFYFYKLFNVCLY